MMPFADLAASLPIFIKTLHLLIKEDIDYVIDTQPLTFPIIKAVRIYNRWKKKEIILEKILTELPTDKVSHFLRPIKNLSSKDRRYLKLITTAPLLEKDQTPAQFWMKHCKLTENQVCYEDFPLRPSFFYYKNKSYELKEELTISIRTKSLKENALIAATIQKSTLEVEIQSDQIRVLIAPFDKVSTLLLGSQPTEKATVEYVKKFIQMAREGRDVPIRHLLFVFCNGKPLQKNSLLIRTHDLVQKTEDYPKNLAIIPMCFQGDDVIAPLYFRSDATFTRAGGLSAMELLAVSHGKIWIHSEAKSVIPPFDQEKLAKGMPIWEKGNALYLKEKKGAEFISPEAFCKACAPYFRKKRLI
ncbi:MAG: hypothetical protein HYZ47_02520 [Simkania negevensis]|nr:hypothetical protein [Simkania negevensis]